MSEFSHNFIINKKCQIVNWIFIHVPSMTRVRISAQTIMLKLGFGRAIEASHLPPLYLLQSVLMCVWDNCFVYN